MLFLSKSKEELNLLFAFFIVIFLPSSLMVFLGLNSLNLGLLIASFYLIIVNLVYSNTIRFSNNALLLFLIIFGLIFFNSIFNLLSHNYFKPVLSLSFLLIIFAGYSLACLVSKISYLALLNIVKWVFLTLSVLAILSLIGVEPSSYSLLEKPIFPFKEQSHFSLIFGLFLFPLVIISTRKIAISLFMWGFFLAITLPNLTLLVFVIVAGGAALLKDKSTLKIAFWLVVLSLLSVFLLKEILKIEYFYSRLSFEDTSNLTVLVYIQGWELIIKTFTDFEFLGIGFQMLGFDKSVLPPTSYVINEVAGSFLNISDGGFLAAKIITEFGFIGFFIVLYFLFGNLLYLFNGFTLPTNLSGSSDLHLNFRLMKLFSFAFMIEVFFRGYGYFSPALLFVISTYFLGRILNEHKSKHCNN